MSITAAKLLACGAALVACQSGKDSTPTTPAQSHFVDSDHHPLPQYEWIWQRLAEVYRDAMPASVVVIFHDGDGGYFNLPTDEVHLSKALFAQDPPRLLAHETSHVCLGHLTSGASAEEGFRFLDEGFAEITSLRIAGGSDAYKQEALSQAAIQARKGNVSFDKVTAWSTYFGNWRGTAPTHPAPYAHPVGASFDFMIIDRFGQPALLELFRSIGRTRSLEQSVQEVLHVELAKLQDDWLTYLSAIPEPAAPRIVELVPGNGATAVSTQVSELVARFDVPMGRNIGIRSSCEPVVSYKNAYWKDPQTLAIRLPDGLPPNASCRLRLSVEQSPLHSRAGAEMPPFDWTFATP